MLSKTMEEALNAQLGKEAYASALYLAMATWAEHKGFEGTAEWFYAQSEEEREHMLKFMRYINERGGHGLVSKVDEPPAQFTDIRAIFEGSLEHEQLVTRSINEIVGKALEEKDFTTYNWIQWFVQEQLEEETSVQRVIDKLNLLGTHSLYLFDRDIQGMRVPEK